MNSAALYVRYSTVEQAEGQSEQRQIQGAERSCREHDGKLVKVYKDLGISGGKSADDRKGLAALLKDLAKCQQRRMGSIGFVIELAGVKFCFASYSLQIFPLSWKQ